MRQVPLRPLLRAAAACVVVLLCGAYSCLGPEGDVTYAPGYGYVVKVHKNPPITQLGDDGQDYHVWFDTEEEARDFIDLKRSDDPYAWEREFWDKINRKEGAVDDEDRDDDEYDKVGRVLRALPPPDLTIPLAVPELPQPIPQTPQ